MTAFVAVVECVTIAVTIGNDFLMAIKINLIWSEYACLPIIYWTFAVFLTILKKNCYSFNELPKAGVVMLIVNSAVCACYVIANSLIFNPWTVGFIIGMCTIVVELTILIILKLPGGVTRDVWLIGVTCLTVVIATVASVPDYWQIKGLAASVWVKIIAAAVALYYYQKWWCCLVFALAIFATGS